MSTMFKKTLYGLIILSAIIFHSQFYVSNEIKTTTTSTNQEEVSDSDSYNKTNVETEPYKPKYDTETYDIYAYRLLTRTVKERKRRSEYVYGGYAVSKTTAETYSIKTSAFTSKDDKDFSFWRFDVDFVPIKGAIVVVKFPKGDHEKYYDISQVYTTIGNPSGDWEW